MDSATGQEAVVQELEEELDHTGALGPSSGTEQGWVSEGEVINSGPGKLGARAPCRGGQ